MSTHLDLHLYTLLLPVAASRARNSTRPHSHVVRVIHSRAWDLASQFFKRLPLGLGDQEGGENTAEHEERVYLHDVVEPWRRVSSGSALGAQRADENLGND